jgi:hypothetical protein
VRSSDAYRSTRRARQTAAPEIEHVPSQTEVHAELDCLNDSAIEKLKTQTVRHRGHLSGSLTRKCSAAKTYAAAGAAARDLKNRKT